MNIEEIKKQHDKSYKQVSLTRDLLRMLKSDDDFDFIHILLGRKPPDSPYRQARKLADEAYSNYQRLFHLYQLAQIEQLDVNETVSCGKETQ